MVFGLKRKSMVSETSVRPTPPPSRCRRLKAVSRPAKPPPRITTCGRVDMTSPRDSPVQMDRFVGDVLDVPGRRLQQASAQVRQGPGDGELVTDLWHGGVMRVLPREADADEARVGAGPQPCLGPRRAVVVLVDEDLNVPAPGVRHGDRLRLVLGRYPTLDVRRVAA